ncbi:MAG: Spo0E like sporulation regulatory protein [Candidatus Petromonas sp.]|jgi:hypothetical protein|nr:Spo0E like sporulation regulatory protein [Candidatus Petromonas sp.]
MNDHILDLKRLENKIENIRGKLQNLTSENLCDLTSPDVIELSQTLDELIVNHMKILQKMKLNKYMVDNSTSIER